MRNPVKYVLGLERKDQRMLFVSLVTATNVVFFAYNLVLGIINMSLWMLINAAFYFVVVVSRYALLKNYRKMRLAKIKTDTKRVAVIEYRNTGFFLVLLSFVYMFVGVYMFNNAVNQDLHEYAVYGTAFMAFWSLGFSIAGVIKYKKNTDLTVRAAVITSLAVAVTAIVATQEILLSRYGGGENYSQINGMVGVAASVAIFIMGISMLLYVRREIPKQ